MSVDEVAPLVGHAVPASSEREFTDHHVMPGYENCHRFCGIKNRRAVVRLAILAVVAVALGYAAYGIYSGIEVKMYC